MTPQTKERSVLIGLLALACATFFTGIGWGLPSRESDRYLFGSADRAWSGAQILATAGPRTPDPHRAADADADPIANRDQIVWLNHTPKQQAEILLRYRLYSYQPDEMLTLRAIGEMPANHFDPRMYQYGGLWFYPIGAMLRTAGALHLIDLRSDTAHYLDHPEAFARFYVVARAYSALWGLAGVAIIFQLTKRFSPSLAVRGVAAACFALMPVTINAAHEAKPHLAGAVLTLAAILAATKFTETGLRKWCVLTGLLCGLATGMVLSAGVAFVILPLMTLLRPETRSARIRRTLLATTIGIAAYCITNPYVPINLVRDPQLVRQNLGALSHAKAITGKSSTVSAIQNAPRLIAAGAGAIVMTVGALGAFCLAFNVEWLRDRSPMRAPALLLAVPALIVLLQFFALAGGKPGEFGRFALLPDIALALCAAGIVGALNWGRKYQLAGFTLLILFTTLQGLPTLLALMEDTHARDTTSTRVAAARELQRLADHGARTLAVRAEPAPYNLPPIDLTHWKLLLLPDANTTDNLPDVIVRPIDTPTAESPNSKYRRMIIQGHWPILTSPISWADKPIEILIRNDLPN